MFVGHIAAGLALKRIEPRVNLGLLVFAAEFADILFFALVLAGVERILPAIRSGDARYYSFDFPYSHGLAAGIAWAVLAGAAAWAITPGARRSFIPAAVLALAMLSHLVLDATVHVPDIPLASEDSTKIGLGLWRNMPVALSFELALTGLAAGVFIRGGRLSRSKLWLLLATLGVTGGLTVAGPYLTGEPPGPAAMAGPSLATLIVVVGLAALIDGSKRLIEPVSEGDVGKQ